MPIRPENRHHYRGAAWRMVRSLTILRSRNRCEWCDAPNGKIVTRAGRFWLDAAMSDWWKQKFGKKRGADVWVAEDGTRFVRFAPPDGPVKEGVEIVLTCAHIDHDPTNNLAANVVALCQRCHNRHDGPHRAETRKRTRAAKAVAL